MLKLEKLIVCISILLSFKSICYFLSSMRVLSFSKAENIQALSLPCIEIGKPTHFQN